MQSFQLFANRTSHGSSVRRRVLASAFGIALIATACGGSAAEVVTEAVDAATAVPEATAEPAPEPTEVPTAAPEPTEVPTAVPESTEVPAAVEPAVTEDGAAADIAVLDPAVAEMGAATWGPSCSSCHGETGEGTGRGRSLVGIALEQPDIAVHIESVTAGKGRMPAFAENLTAEEISAVVSWARAEF